MGNRYILEVTCPNCGYTDYDVYYAPTCDFTEWCCPECNSIIDLEDYTGITYEEASNLDSINEIIKDIK